MCSHIKLYCVVLCCVVSYCIVLLRAALRCVVLYRLTVSSSSHSHRLTVLIIVGYHRRLPSYLKVTFTFYSHGTCTCTALSTARHGKGKGRRRWAFYPTSERHSPFRLRVCFRFCLVHECEKGPHRVVWRAGRRASLMFCGHYITRLRPLRCGMEVLPIKRS